MFPFFFLERLIPLKKDGEATTMVVNDAEYDLRGPRVDAPHSALASRNTILTDHERGRQQSRNPKCVSLKRHHSEAPGHSVPVDHASVKKRDISCKCLPKTFPGLFFQRNCE